MSSSPQGRGAGEAPGLPLSGALPGRALRPPPPPSRPAGWPGPGSALPLLCPPLARPTPRPTGGLARAASHGAGRRAGKVPFSLSRGPGELRAGVGALT